MPLENDSLEPRKQFKVLEDGTYQVVIKDIEKFDGKNYNTGEPETQYKFTLKVVDEGEDLGFTWPVFSSTAYGPAKGIRPESKLYTIVNKALGNNPAAEDLHLNELIGKQVKVVVSKTTNESGYDRNKIVAWQSVKKDLSVPEDTADIAEEVMNGKRNKAIDKAVDKLKPGEEINLDDIKF